ncbi:MAG: S-formylglutathione hydrolase, partial [Bdellovibrionales bacterium]
MKVIEEHRCFGGRLQVVEHDSSALSCVMRFSVFVPPQAEEGPCPALFFLSGLTCTHENFTTKAGAYKKAAALGIVIIAPDTSPRGDDVPDDEGYDFGKGAGFYINAVLDPWAKHYQMEDYIAAELYDLVVAEFPVDAGRIGISGHSMGGHGALTLYFKYPEKFASCSAFSPIVAPAVVPWGEKAFSRYLGGDQQEWFKHDACELVRHAGVARDRAILIDQGTADDFLTAQLKPELFEDACKGAGQALNLRMQDGYDHSYYFISS